MVGLGLPLITPALNESRVYFEWELEDYFNELYQDVVYLIGAAIEAKDSILLKKLYKGVSIKEDHTDLLYCFNIAIGVPDPFFLEAPHIMDLPHKIAKRIHTLIYQRLKFHSVEMHFKAEQEKRRLLYYYILEGEINEDKL